MARIQNTAMFFLALFFVISCGKDNPASNALGGDSGVSVACADFEGCVDSPPLSIHPNMSVRAFPTMDARLSDLKNDLDLILNLCQKKLSK